MGHGIRKTGIITAALVLFSVFCFCMPAFAEKAPAIAVVAVDLTNHSMLINGARFEPGSDHIAFPKVFLGGEKLTIVSHSDGLINATLPDDITNGSYLLKVFRTSDKSAAFEVTIGTASFGTDTNQAATGAGAECTVGEILLTAGAVANGMPASGQILLINDYDVLFSLLGTTYGGDGDTTFALPDMRAIAPNHMTYSICIFGVYPSQN